MRSGCWSEDPDTTEEECVGQRERKRLKQKETRGGVSRESEWRWSEKCNGIQRFLSLIELYVRMRSSCLIALCVAALQGCTFL